MTTFTNICRWLLLLSGSLCLLAFGYAALAVRSAVLEVPVQITALEAATLAEVDVTSQRLTAQVEAARKDLLAVTERQVAGLRVDTFAEVGEIRKTADRRLGDTLTRVDAAISQVDAIRADLKPVLTNTATAAKNASDLTADAKDSWDDLYWDIKGSVASGTVAITGVARAAEAVGKAAPEVTAAVASISESSKSVAANVAREVDAATKPKKWWQQVLGPVYTVGRLMAAFL